LELFVNDKAFAALSPEYKAILKCAAALAHTEMQAKYDAKNPKALKELVGNKVKVLPFPKDVMDLAYKTSMEIYAELNEKNPNWKKVYEDYATFRRDQNLWFRFTEMRFDQFMQAQKL
jgi:TRAP-type mannitol/chloroaromatic compound transport system substrate-binding protein